MSQPSPLRWRALVILALAQFIVIMDTSIIGVALPEIGADLGFAQADLSWVFNAYVIAFGGLLLLGGKLSDVFGARRLFLIGFAILTGASVLAGLADAPGVLIASRALQGVGAALIAPTSLAMLMQLFGHDPRELTKALALYGAAAPAGGTAGVFLGGVLTESLSWPWVFYVNIPVGLAVLALAPRWCPMGVRGRGKIDVAGALTITASLSLIVFGIVRGPEVGWSEGDVAGTLLAGVALLGLFVGIQRLRRDPLMPLGIFRTPNLAAANLAMALLGAAWVPMWFYLNLYLQQVLGYGPFGSGAALLPMTILMMILMVGVTERVVRRFGFRSTLSVGLTVLAAGLGLLSLVSAGGSFTGDVLLGSLVAAVGMSLAYIPAMFAAMSGAKPAEAGLASGIVNTTYQIGSALGLAAMTAVATSNGAGQIGNPAALVDGYSSAFVGAAVIALVGALVGIALIRRPIVEPDVETEAAQPVAA